MTTPKRLLELEQALAELPPTTVGEILFGRLVAQPRPAVRDSVAASSLGEALGPPFKRGIGGPGGWIILFEPELQLGPHVLVPDLAGWRRDTVPDMVEFEGAKRLGLVPDWVCEVLSPGTEHIDRDEKMLIYGANGVGHLWFVDARVRRLEAYRNERGRWIERAVHEGDAPARIEPFEAAELPIAWLWKA